MNAQEAAEILGITRRRNGDLREMVRALTLFPWFNTAEDVVLVLFPVSQRPQRCFRRFALLTGNDNQ